MNYPKLLKLSSINEYKRYYEKKYCLSPLKTYDGIPVYFNKKLFSHAFFESYQRNNIKDKFSIIRAERMDWIEATLKNPKAELYQGWDKKRKKHDQRWRVNVVYGDYVVVLKIRLTQSKKIKAEFRTAFKADYSIEKIRKSPKWDKSLLSL